MNYFLTTLSEIGVGALFVLFVIAVLFLAGCVNGFWIKFSCKHDWEEIKQVDRYYKGKIIGYLFIFECKKCGSFKKVKIYG